MRIGFFMRNIGYVRNFEWVMRRLSEKGHELRVVIDRRKMESSEQAAYAHIDALTRDCGNIQFEELLREAKDSSLGVIATRYTRLLQDYARYLDPAFADAPKLRERSGNPLNPMVCRMIDIAGKSATFRRGFIRFLSWLDRLIPPPSHITNYVRKLNPDLLMVTPLLDFGSPQPDYFKAAAQLGIRSCLPVASWDNLTSKGLINIKPNRVLVWNKSQECEALDLHGLKPGEVFVTGAHSYDHWFTWKPSSTREAFLAKVGLKPDQPFVLFLGSSRFIAPDEPPVVMKWARALRESGDPLLRDVGILIRPHPQNAANWAERDVSSIGNATVFPREGSNPVSPAAKSEYFDSMYHCDLVVGVNTSAMIESGILGKAVYTVLFDEMAGTQEGTLHFHHLSDERDGLLHVARDLDTHVAALGAALRDPADTKRRSKIFVDHFVRPTSLEKLPTEVAVDVLEEQLALPAPAPKIATLGTTLARFAAAPLLLVCVPAYVRGRLRRQSKRKAKLTARRLALEHSASDIRDGG